MLDTTFKVEEDGILKEYKIVKILTPKNSTNRYIIYTDSNNEYYASKYETQNNEIILKEITDEIEWNYIQERMKEIN